MLLAPAAPMRTAAWPAAWPAMRGGGAPPRATPSAARAKPPGAPPAMASAALAAAAAAVARRARRPAPGRLPPSRGSAAVRRVRRDLHLDGYPVHGPGYYWSLSKCSEFVKIFMPIADDVSSKDIIYSFSDWTLKLGIQPEKGDMVIDDKVLYKVDMNESYFVIDDGEYGERCVVVWLCKYGKENDWYAYDRFSPAWERFLLEGEKRRADLTFKITDKAYLDIAVDGKEFGRVVLGLYGEICPRTVKNFLCLCTGEKGEGEEGPLHYKDTRIHRIVKGFCIQGGQTFETEDGDGGESIYGGLFEDENLRVKFRIKARYHRHGEWRPRHERLSVLHHHCESRPHQPQVCRLRRSFGGVQGGQCFGEPCRSIR
ncbi:unnamed protein product [Prorocentrum cordatum]|uniref:Peptidylprolyl isomerase n=1 Tax=Prorocentrum cordatum TaxID=2364126 RepID=A0ABN9W7Q2_9DINO|nr:unnamed protein product [Polarella glacialis]